MKNIFMQEKFILQLTFNPGLALTGSVLNNSALITMLITIPLGLLFVPAIQLKSRYVVSGLLQNLSAQYGHVILVSRYLVMDVQYQRCMLLSKVPCPISWSMAAMLCDVVVVVAFTAIILCGSP